MITAACARRQGPAYAGLIARLDASAEGSRALAFAMERARAIINSASGAR